MKKTRSRKSRDTVPLIKGLNYRSCNLAYLGNTNRHATSGLFWYQERLHSSASSLSRMMAKVLDSAIWMMSERKYMRLVTTVVGWPVSLS